MSERADDQRGEGSGYGRRKYKSTSITAAVQFEFTVEGPPLSLQASRPSLERWKTTVKAAACARWPVGDLPTTDTLRCKIVYYYLGPTPDVDNIIKPIQDALKSLVYADDAQIHDTQCKKKDMNGSFKIKGITPLLADAFVNDKEFLHITVSTNMESGDLE